MADDVDISDSLDALGLTEQELNGLVVDEVKPALDLTATEVRSYWRTLSPDETGHYDDTIEIYEIESKAGEAGRRVNATAEYAHIIEYGSEDTEAYGVRAAVAQSFQCDGAYLVDED